MAKKRIYARFTLQNDTLPFTGDTEKNRGVHVKIRQRHGGIRGQDNNNETQLRETSGTKT